MCVLHRPAHVGDRLMSEQTVPANVCVVSCVQVFSGNVTVQ